MARGRMVYVPPVIIEELESIKEDHSLIKNTEAYRKMVKYSRLGREFEKIRRDEPIRKRRGRGFF